MDVGPDFRNQFLNFANKQIPDYFLITHAHNDHIAGIGDLAESHDIDFKLGDELPADVSLAYDGFELQF